MSDVLFTGWYCTEGLRIEYTARGDDEIRGLRFRSLWWEAINQFAEPRHVVIVDSASPVPPDDRRYFSGGLETIRLMVNPGHSQNTSFHYCGWTASVLLGLEYALSNDLDYFLYVEQDALIFGEKFLPAIKRALLRSPYVFGSGQGTPWPLQQSVFALRKDVMRDFLSRMHRIPHGDNIIYPELKFGLSVKRPWPCALALDALGHMKLRAQFRRRILNRLLGALGGFERLPFGYGRTRPIYFEDDCFYFQHASRAELDAFRRRLGHAGAPGTQAAG